MIEFIFFLAFIFWILVWSDFIKRLLGWEQFLPLIIGLLLASFVINMIFSTFYYEDERLVYGLILTYFLIPAGGLIIFFLKGLKQKEINPSHQQFLKIVWHSAGKKVLGAVVGIIIVYIVIYVADAISFRSNNGGWYFPPFFQYFF